MYDEKMTEQKCPWDTAPKTIEGLIESSEKQAAWEGETGHPAPYLWNIIVTREMFSEIAKRLVAVEEIVYSRLTV